MYKIIKIDNGTLLKGYYDQTWRSDFSHHKRLKSKIRFQYLKSAQSKREFSLNLKKKNDDRSLSLKSDGISTLEERRSAR